MRTIKHACANSLTSRRVGLMSAAVAVLALGACESDSTKRRVPNPFGTDAVSAGNTNVTVGGPDDGNATGGTYHPSNTDQRYRSNPR